METTLAQERTSQIEEDRFNFLQDFEIVKVHGSLRYRPCPVKIEEILFAIMDAGTPIGIKKEYTTMMQLLVDGLIDKRLPAKNLETAVADRKRVLSEACDLGGSLMANFYRGEAIDYEGVWGWVEENEELLIKFSSRKESKSQHLSNCINGKSRFGSDLRFLENERIDSVVPIASDGIESGLLAGELLDAEVIPVRYSRMARREGTVKFPKCHPREKFNERFVTGKNVLVVEGYCCTGETSKKVIDTIREGGPDSLYFAAVIANGFSHGDPLSEDIEVSPKKTHEGSLIF